MIAVLFTGLFDHDLGSSAILAMTLGGVAAVDAAYRLIVENGYQGYKAPWDAFWGQHYAVVVDPDGNLIDLFASLSPQ